MKKILSIFVVLILLCGCSASKTPDLSFNKDVGYQELIYSKTHCNSILYTASKIIDNYLNRVNGQYKLFMNDMYILPDPTTNQDGMKMMLPAMTWYGSDKWYKKVYIYFDYEEKNGNVYINKIALEDENGEDKIIYKK